MSLLFALACQNNWEKPGKNIVFAFLSLEGILLCKPFHQEAQCAEKQAANLLKKFLKTSQQFEGDSSITRIPKGAFRWSNRRIFGLLSCTEKTPFFKKRTTLCVSIIWSDSRTCKSLCNFDTSPRAISILYGRKYWNIGRIGSTFLWAN